MKAIETTDFQKDIDAIDEFVYGKIDQETWQSEPIEHEGKTYIKWKPIIDGVFKREIVTIILDDENFV